jgi:outer membrane protein
VHPAFLFRPAARRRSSGPLPVVPLLILGALGPAAGPAAAERFTLDEAVARAIAANPQLEGARAQIDAAEARRLIALSAIFPKITLSGDYTRNNEEVSFGSGGDTRVILPKDDWGVTLSLRQPIFAGLREKRAYEQSKLARAQLEAGLSDTQAALVLRVATNSLAMLEAEALVEVELRNFELAERRRKQSGDFFEVGEVTRVDVLRAEAALKGAERRLVAARSDRERAAGELRADLALEGPIEIAPPGEFLPPLPALAELIQAALAGSHQARQLRLAVQSGELEIKKQKGARLPTVFLDGGMIWQASTFPSDEYSFLTLNLSLPIFTGGELRGRVREAEANLRLARSRLEDFERNLREDVSNSWRDVNAARKVLELSREELEVTEQQYAESFALYQAQEAIALDLENSEIALADARRRVASAEVAVQNLELRAFYLTGTLGPGLLRGSAETPETPSPAPAPESQP